ncbi:MAG: hypothetical protein Kow0090_08970 [Myxococcota bacterium]
MASLTREQLEKVCIELDVGLSGAQLDGAYQPDELTLYLSFWKPSLGARLFYVSVRPLETRMHLVHTRVPNPPKPFGFQSFLRKHLKNARLIAVKVQPGERRAAIFFKRRDNPKSFFLLVELYNTAGRIAVLDEAGKVLRVQGALDISGRSVRSGVVYEEVRAWLAGVALSETRGENPQFGFEYNYSLADEFGGGGEIAREETLRRQIAARVKKLEKTARNVEGDLERAERALAEAEKAEWLKPVVGSLKRGISEVELETPVGKIKLELDPSLSPQDNLNRIFERAKRFRKRIEEIKRRLSGLLEDKKRLEKLLLFSGEEFLEGAAGFGWFAVGKGGVGGEKRAKQRHVSYREFTSSSGMKILVGKGGKDNNELTFKVASSKDYWLHTKGFAGSHTVIVCGKNKLPDERTAMEAAQLAAHFSKAPMGERVEVVYVKRAFVKPVKGEAGKVIYTNERTIVVMKSDEIILKLGKQGEEV